MTAGELLTLNHSLNVPKKERQKVANTVYKVSHHTSPNENDLRYLFSIWNNHLSRGEVEDIGCSGCRAKVVSKLRFMSKLWLRKELITTISK